MGAGVVGLGAWCDLDPIEGGGAASSGPSPVEARSGWSPVYPGEAGASPGGAHFRVHEFAVLADGRRVTLRDDLGFSLWSRSVDAASGVTRRLDPWAGLDRASVESSVRAVVLPDDDDSVDAHPYEWLRELCAQQGIETTVQELRAVPYVVELSERLERRLADGGISSGS